MIELTKTGIHWIATINRPDKANSLTRDMLAELADIAEAAEVAQVPALILTGKGKVFSAGADLDQARAGLATDDVWERLSGAVAAFSGLSICAMNGTLAGGACGMALACDMRLSVPGAKVFYPVMKLGFLPQPSDPVRMRALIGPARTKMILMGGAKITTDEAYAFGLIDRIVPADELLEQAIALTESVAGAKPELRAAIKGMCA